MKPAVTSNWQPAASRTTTVLRKRFEKGKGKRFREILLKVNNGCTDQARFCGWSSDKIRKSRWVLETARAFVTASPFQAGYPAQPVLSVSNTVNYRYGFHLVISSIPVRIPSSRFPHGVNHIEVGSTSVGVAVSFTGVHSTPFSRVEAR